MISEGIGPAAIVGPQQYVWYRDLIPLHLEEQDEERSPPECGGMAGQVGVFHHPAVSWGQDMVHQGLGILAHGLEQLNR
jgi:hypothetical protein